VPRGDHVSIWFANEDRWLFETIEALQDSFLDAGLPISKSQLMVAIIKCGITEYAKQTKDKLSE